MENHEISMANYVERGRDSGGVDGARRPQKHKKHSQIIAFTLGRVALSNGRLLLRKIHKNGPLTALL